MSTNNVPPQSSPAPTTSAKQENGPFYNMMWLPALAAGALMAMAFVPYDIGFLVWVGLLPILTILWVGPARFWRGFRMGWMFGMGWYCVSFSWIHEVGYVFDIPCAVFTNIAFVPLMALYSCLPGIWAGIMATWLRPQLSRSPEQKDIARYGKKSAWKSWATADLFSTLRVAVGGAALWVCLEWVRAHGTLGFSWNSLGMGMYHGLSLVQWAEFVGTAALSFVPAFINIILWGAGRRAYLYFRGASGFCRTWDFYGSMVLLFMMFVGGMFLAKAYAPAAMMQRESTLQLPVLAVQINQDQVERMSIRRKRPTMLTNVQNERYLSATQSAFEQVLREQMQQAFDNKHGLAFTLAKPAWVIWPESALGVDLWRNIEDDSHFNINGYLNSEDTDKLFNESLPALRRQTYSPFVLITGVDERRFSGSSVSRDAGRGMLNSMAFIPGGFESIRTASKQHLMPFGEYIPYADSCEWLRSIYTEITGTQVSDGIHRGTGSEPIPMPVPGTDETVGVIPAVCYEDTVGDKLTKFVRQGPQVIVNVSNDAWFRDSACGAQQARNAAFRCIELRRCMVRAANKGVTCAIAPNGAVIDALLNEDGTPHLAGYSYAVLPVDRNGGFTVYALMGDWAVILCALLALLCASPVIVERLSARAERRRAQ